MPSLRNMSSASSHSTTFLPANISLITLAVSALGISPETLIGSGGFRRIKSVTPGMCGAPVCRARAEAWSYCYRHGTSITPFAWNHYPKLDAADLCCVGEHNQVIGASPIELKRDDRQPQFSARCFIRIPAFAGARRSE